MDCINYINMEITQYLLSQRMNCCAVGGRHIIPRFGRLVRSGRTRASSTHNRTLKCISTSICTKRHHVIGNPTITGITEDNIMTWYSKKSKML